MWIVVIIIAFILIGAIFGEPSSSQKYSNISEVDTMKGQDFEKWCADILQYNGFTNIRVTRGSGDQGVDITAWKNGKSWAIQCKRYAKKLGNKPIQEVNTGRVIYKCDIAAVMTNNYFTAGAVEAAKATGVYLWDRSVVQNMAKIKNDILYKRSQEYKRQERRKRKEENGKKKSADFVKREKRPRHMG